MRAAFVLQPAGAVALPNVQRFLSTCTFVPAMLNGEAVACEHRMWVRVSDQG